MMKPDGFTVTVPVPVLYPEAVAVSVDVPRLCACTQTVPTLVDVTPVKVTDGWPKVLALLETVAMDVPLLVTVTLTGVSGVALRNAHPESNTANRRAERRITRTLRRTNIARLHNQPTQ